MLVGFVDNSSKSYSTLPSIPIELNPVIYVPDILNTSFIDGSTFVAAKRIFEDFSIFDDFCIDFTSSNRSSKSIATIESYTLSASTMSTSNDYVDAMANFGTEANLGVALGILVFTSIGALIVMSSSLVLGDIPMYDL